MTQLRTIGQSLLTTPPLILGGNVLGWTSDQASSFAVMDAFVAGGGTMIDTADVYSAWVPGHVGGSIINPVTHRPTITFTSPTTHQSIGVLTSKLNPVTYNPDAKVAAAAVRIGHKVDPVKVAYLTFLGPLIGSLVRPIGGALADRFGGARTTFLNFAGMVLCGVLVLVASLQASLPLFMVAFIALFVLSGIGNGSTYKMIPTIFRSKAQAAVAGGADPAQADLRSRRHSGALIGIAGAIGAFGGVLVNIAFRQSFLSRGNGDAAYVAFIAFYLACAALTWVVYLRRSSTRLAGV